MATRSPTPFHSFWGGFPTASLPNGPELEVGDTAFDTTLGQLVVCTAVGPVVWSVVGGGGGGGVTSVGASAPVTSTGGTTPTIGLGTVGVANGGTGLTATPANGQIPIGNGSGYTLNTLTAGAGITITNAAGAVTVAANASAPQAIVLDGTATGGAATIIGTLYVPAARTLTAASVAYLGGSLVTDTATLTLVPAGGGSPVATWTHTGTLGNEALTSGGTIAAAGWYDLTLQETAGSGTAFARGLYLA